MKYAAYAKPVLPIVLHVAKIDDVNWIIPM